MTVRLTISLHAVNVRRGSDWVLQQISWQLKRGERWALIGSNGSGKTQLLKLLGADVWPTPETRAQLTYQLGRIPVDLIEAKRRIAYIGAERQDKYARYGWNLHVRDVVATGLHRTDLLLQPVNSNERRRILAMLRICGLAGLAGRGFLSLSYGEKRLVLLARALVQDPDWLLLDEFYNGLDADYRRRMDSILDSARRRGQSWIASAHRAIDVPRGTRRLLELDQGRVHSIGFVHRTDLARLTHRANDAPRKMLRSEARKPASADPLLCLARADLYVDYRPVLRNLNWELRDGEHWAVFGANGSGKSSFLKLLYGDLSPARGGRIERRGFPRGTPIEEWKRQVGYVSPELQTDYSIDVNVLQLVASGRYASIGLANKLNSQDHGHAMRWLKFFRLLAFAKRRPRELSYGQMRRALFARALVASPNILLLDEPFTGLDPAQRAAMKKMLERLMQQQLTVIMAVHHAEDLPRGITHALHLHKRRAYLTDSHSAT